MKLKIVLTALALAAAMTLIPLPSLGREVSGSSGGGTITLSDEVKMYDTDSGAVITLTLSDYLFGVTAAEMSPSAPDEALKAQIIAAHTFLLYRRANGGRDYDITNSPSTDQAYISRSDARRRFGSSADKYCQKLDRLVEEAGSLVLVDSQRRPILAAYHSLSSGRTETAKVVWGKDYPYLQAVDSVGDLLSPDYLSEVSFTPEQLADRLADDVKLESDCSKWLGKQTRSESGTVISLAVGGKNLSGQRLRTLLGLRSAAFEVVYAEDKFTFTVQGSGHGVGMSQYGAAYLAGLGSTSDEILAWYYKGCTLVSCDSL